MENISKIVFRKYVIVIVTLFLFSSNAFAEIRIGSLNTLGLGGSREKDLSGIANIIKSENLSIVALQEVSSKSGVEDLVNQLGGGWEYSISENDNNKCNGECFAFIWNGSHNIAREPSIPWHKTPPLKHPPFVEGFRNGTKLFWLINVHIFHGNTVGERDAEIKEILKFYEVFAKSYEGYSIILGDFNRECENMPFVQLPFYCAPNSQTTLKKKENQYHSKYDHFCFNDEVRNELEPEFARIEAPEKYYKGDFGKYQQRVSDHIPIRMDIGKEKNFFEQSKGKLQNLFNFAN